MPILPLDTTGLAKILDSKAAAAATAKAIHGQSTTLPGKVPAPHEEYLWSGTVYVDRVEGDTVEASWVLPLGNGELHRVAKLRLLAGSSSGGSPQYMIFLETSHSKSVLTGTSYKGGGYGPALKEAWGKLFEDPWTTLVRQDPNGDEMEAGGDLQEADEKAVSYGYLSLALQLAIVVWITVGSTDRHFWQTFRPEHLLAGMAATLGLLAWIQVLRHRALGRIAAGMRKRIQDSLAGGKV